MATDDGGSGNGDGAGQSDAPADLCASGDSTCRVSCLASDPDCTTTCGDGVCVGNAGELCTTCAADCNTRSTTVCGNGQCDPGEDSDVCYADCGPTPWPWIVAENDMDAVVNDARTNGFDCPGGGGATTAAPLTRITSLDLGAREWAWEISFAKLTGTASCNGRTLADRLSGAGNMGGGAAWIANGHATSSAALADLLAAQASCDSIMSTSYTRLGVGVAESDGLITYVIILD